MSPPVTCLDAEPVEDGDGAAAVDDHRHDHDEKGRAVDQSEISIVTIHQSQLTWPQYSSSGPIREEY